MIRKAGRFSLQSNNMLLPYGPAVIVSCLKQAGFDAFLLDLRNAIGTNTANNLTSNDFESWLEHDCVRSAMDNYLAECLKVLPNISNVKLIGISIFSYLAYPYALSLAKEIKRRHPEITMCLGGPYVSIKNLTLPDFVDFVVKGCGGQPMTHLANHLINGVEFNLSFPGLYYRNENGLVDNGPNHESADMEALPDFSDLNLDRYLVKKTKIAPSLKHNILFIPYRTSLGCSNTCSFCTGRLVSSLSFKSVDKVISELKILKSLHPNAFIRFTDASINNNPTLISRILDRIIAEKLEINWWAFIKVKGANTGFLDKAQKAGCMILAWGIENFSPHMISIYNKAFNPKDAIEYIQYASNLGIINEVYVIMNGPGETSNDIDITRKAVVRLSKHKNVFLKLFSFMLEEGSSIHTYPNKYNIEISKTRTQRLYDIRRDGEQWRDLSIDTTDYASIKRFRDKRIAQLINFISMSEHLRYYGLNLPFPSIFILSILYSKTKQLKRTMRSCLARNCPVFISSIFSRPF